MTITREEMASLDKRAIEEFGISGLLLMEVAAVKIFERVKDYSSFLVLVGPGNNGEDGLALARHLLVAGKKVLVYIIKEPKTSEAIENLNILKKLTRNIHFHKSGQYDIIKNYLEDYYLCLDGIFGIGLKKPIDGDIKELINLVNQKAKEIIAIDIPSGLYANTGQALGVAIKANKTITVHDKKIGMENSDYTGDIEIIKIGIPEKYYNRGEE